MTRTAAATSRAGDDRNSPAPMEEPTPSPLPETPPAKPGVIGDFLAVLRFYSRLPAPRLARESDPYGLPDFARAAWAIPLVGALIGGCGALIGLGAYLVGLSTTLAAILTIATLAIVTGAFHEDGLADSCDGLWGGATRERRLEIMKDSRVGTYGATALALSLALRAFALAEIFRLTGPSALVIVIGIAAATRPLALIPALTLTPAAGTGLAAGVPMPGPLALAISIALGLGVLAGAAYWTDLIGGLPTALMALVIVHVLLIRVVEKKIGGFTGDILGAFQQINEIVLLLGLSAAANWTGAV
jgi:adenosylcobinamide-GDP ribazoletransferase